MVHFRPFYFEARIAAGFAVSAGGFSFASVTLEGSISGPGPIDIRAVADADDRQTHFIGSILATADTGDAAALTLIDGQQRITTLTRPQRSTGPSRPAQLSPGTLCTFLREFSSFQARKELLTGSDRDPGYGSAHLRVPMGGPCFFRLRRRTYSPRVPPWSERRSALHGHAAASTDGHVSHDADRLSAGRVSDVALFLPFPCNKEQQTAASGGTKRRSEIAGFYEG